MALNHLLLYREQYSRQELKRKSTKNIGF